jgi:hypothetical protein
MPPHQAAQYEARIELLNRDVKSRDEIINSLTEKLRAAEHQRDEEAAPPQKKPRPKAKPAAKPPPKADRPHRRKVDVPDENSEDGADHLDTEYRRYLAERPKKYVGSRTRVPPSKRRSRRDESDEYAPDGEGDSASGGWI